MSYIYAAIGVAGVVLLGLGGMFIRAFRNSARAEGAANAQAQISKAEADATRAASQELIKPVTKDDAADAADKGRF